MNNAFDYASFQTVLKNADCKKDPGEIHGILCGLLCSDHGANINDYVHLIFEQFDPNDLLFGEACTHIQALQHSSLDQLNDPTCDFHLLCPDDSFELSDKIMSLGDWCQGFLFGLNAGGITDIDSLPGDCPEIIKDFVEIARIGTSYDASDDEEEDENAYEQFVEFIRMGVLLVNEELQPSKASDHTPKNASPDNSM